MLFAGFEVADGTFSLFAVVAAGVLGEPDRLVDRVRVGYYGRIELLERHGKWLHIKPQAPRSGPTTGSSSTGMRRSSSRG